MRGVTAKLTDTQLGSRTNYNQKRGVKISTKKESSSKASMEGMTDKLTINQLDGHFIHDKIEGK